MNISKQKVSLGDDDIKKAIKDYVEKSYNYRYKISGDISLSSAVTSSSYNSNLVSGSCEVEPAVINPLTIKDPVNTYKLRHRETGLFVDSIIFDNGIKMSVGPVGKQWNAVGDIFNQCKVLIENAKKSYFPSTETKAHELKYENYKQQIKEDFLKFEIVCFGEIKSEDVTFHLDLLGKV